MTRLTRWRLRALLIVIRAADGLVDLVLDRIEQVAAVSSGDACDAALNCDSVADGLQFIAAARRDNAGRAR